jgi:hypothetical protein
MIRIGGNAMSSNIEIDLFWIDTPRQPDIERRDRGNLPRFGAIGIAAVAAALAASRPAPALQLVAPSPASEPLSRVRG